MTVPQETAPSGASTDTASTRPSAADTGLRTDEEHACNLTQLAGSPLPALPPGFGTGLSTTEFNDGQGPVSLATTGASASAALAPTTIYEKPLSSLRACHERGDGVADHRHMERELDVSDCAEVADGPQPMRSGQWSGLTERRLTLTRLRDTVSKDAGEIRARP